ncbi:MAG: Trm112 family protein [Desulfovibrionaceae bacterium]|nr:Trm112 family protein [Desulfovibrionaceae bacterium]
MNISNTDLLDILACPRCRGQLTLLHEGADDAGLACPQCHVVYPVQEGIPIMLADAAIPEEQWAQGARKAK